MTGFWITGSQFLLGLEAGSGGGEPFTDRGLTISMDHTEIHNGDRVARILVAYSFHSQLHENVTATDLVPRPWAVTAWYRPDPQADPFSTDEVIGSYTGDALFTDFTKWTPTRWTDGTLHSTQWHCNSGGVVSCQGNRTIIDKTTAVVRMGVDILEDGFGTIATGLSGWLMCKALIERRFG